MKKYEVHEKSWDGILYPVFKEKSKIVITVSGSEGGLEHAGKLARFLQDNGIPALAFGLFKTKHSQRNLARIPLERIYSVIVWLRKNGYHNIAAEGVSKGAEYVLAAAIEFSELSCVIIKTPSWFYSEGLISHPVGVIWGKSFLLLRIKQENLIWPKCCGKPENSIS